MTVENVLGNKSRSIICHCILR